MNSHAAQKLGRLHDPRLKCDENGLQSLWQDLTPLGNEMRVLSALIDQVATRIRYLYHRNGRQSIPVQVPLID